MRVKWLLLKGGPKWDSKSGLNFLGKIPLFFSSYSVKHEKCHNLTGETKMLLKPSALGNLNLFLENKPAVVITYCIPVIVTSNSRHFLFFIRSSLCIWRRNKYNEQNWLVIVMQHLLPHKYCRNAAHKV